MKSIKYLVWAIALIIASAVVGRASTLYFDFGTTNYLTTITSPYYNNITFPAAGGSGFASTTSVGVTNCVDSLGFATPVTLSTTLGSGSTSFLTFNNSGTASPTGAAAIFAATATEDYFYGQNGQNAAISMTGLDTSGKSSYTFTFFGSRTGVDPVTDNRETQYQVVGANSGVAYLNPSGNTSNVCMVTGIIPNASGTVTINVTKGPNNNDGSNFFHLNAMMVQSSTIQDFEGFPNSAALSATILYPTANSTVTLGATSGLNGSQAMILQGTNTVSPFYTSVTLPVSNFSLTNVQSVTVAVKFISGTSEPLIIKLLDSYNVTIDSGPSISTGTIPSTGFTNYTIAITNITANPVAKIQFAYSSTYSGTTVCAFDNIALVMNQTMPIVQSNATASAITYGQTLASSTLTGAALTNAATWQAVGLAGTYFVAPTLAPNAGTTNVQVYYVPVDSVDYTNATNTVTVTVNTNTPGLSLQASAISYGQTLASSSLSGSVATNSFNSSTVAGTFVFTTPSLQPGSFGTTNVSVRFTPTDTNNYYSVTSTVAVTVNGGVIPTLTSLPTPSAISYGQTLASSTLTGGGATNASGGVAVGGTFAFTTPSITPNAGSTNVSVTFTPTDINYVSVTTNVTVSVSKTTPVLTAPTAGTVGLGWPLSSTTLSGGAATNSFNSISVSGSFAFTTPSIKPGLGATNVSVTFTPTDTSNYNSAIATVTVNVTHGTLSFFGTSVMKGYAASGAAANVLINGSFSNSYPALLTGDLLAKGYSVTNNSLGGDYTANGIVRFGAEVVPVKPNYVFLGYSLGNDNLAGSSDPAKTVVTFAANLTNMITQCRTNGYYPVTILCYSRNTIEAANRAAYFEAMNLTINSWNLPSVNIDGAMNDGNGGLISGIDFGDGVHPNDYGHREVYYTIPPTLFDAIGLGKTNSPYLSSSTNFARLTQNGSVTAPITFTPTNTVHSFTMSFRVRSTNNGTIAAIHTGSGYATLQITNGQFVYVSPSGSSIIASSFNATNGDWHDIALASRYALTNTWLFVDGIQVGGSLTEQYAPDQFILGGPGGSGAPATPATVDFQDWCVYRSAWNSLAAQAQAQGSLQQASMEIGAMLDDALFTSNSPASNRAQSFSVALVNTPNLTAMQSVTPPSYLFAQSLSGTVAKLAWTRNSTTESGFVIEQRVTGSTVWSYVATVPAGTTTYTNSGLTLGVSYDYRVAAQEGGLTGNYSNIATGTAGVGVHPTVLVDFGPNDGTNGVVTVSPDYLGQYWNNLAGVNGSGNSLGLANLITTANSATTLGLTSGSSGWTCNGILNGGLLTPSYSLLGNFAVATATEDYFFTGNTATPASLTITNLDATLNYRLRLFASRVQPSATNDIRISRYIVTGANGPFTNDLQTTGYGIGAGGYNGNNSNIVSVLGVSPNASNQIQVGVLSVGSTVNAYLGIMEITANHSPAAQPFSLTTGVGQHLSVDVIDGTNAPTDADGDGTTVTAVSGILSGIGIAATNGGTGFSYTASTAGTNTFSYTVTDTFGGIGTNLVTVVVTNTGKLTPTATLSVNNTPVTYNGLAQAAGVVTNSSSVPGTVSNVRYNGSPTVPTAAGTYNITADFMPNDSTNYNNLAGVTAGSFVINQANATITVTPYSVTYDGNPHTATVSTITGVNGENGATVGAVDVSGTTHTAAGTYNGDAWTFTGSGNYSNTNGTVNDAIAKAEPVLNLVSSSIIQDFEGFADSAALNAAITNVMANTTVTLGSTNGVNGSKALIFQGNNAINPWFSQFTLPVTNFSLAGVQGVTVAMKFISGSAEKLLIELIDVNGYTVLAQGPQILTTTISNASFATYTIGVANLSSTVARVRFSYSAFSYGSTVVAFDNISVARPTSTNTGTYNGTAQEVAMVNSSVPGTVSNVRYNGSATGATAAGTYSVTADFVPNDSTNYNSLTGASAGSFVIGKATPGLSLGSSSTIQDFEGFASSSALNAVITQSTANATVTLGATNGVSGSKALILQGANTVSPFYTSIKLPLSSFSPTNGQSVTVAVKSISGTSENLIISLLDANNVPINQGPTILTGTIPSTGFTNYTIPITNTSSPVAGILLSYSVVSYSGTTTVAFDNISVITPVTYNGAAQSAVVNGSVPGTVSDVRYNGSATVPTAAGTYTVTADFAPIDSTDYSSLTGATAGNFTISQASISVGATSTKNPSGYKDAVSFLATLPADATGNVVFSSTNAPLSTNSLTAGSATSLSITNLPRGTNLITVAYLGDGNYVGSTNTLNQVVTNHPPVASDATCYRTKGLSLKIAITDLLTNVTDVDGDPISLSSVGAGLTNATIMTDSTYVYYLPATGAGSNDNDSVSYNVSDGFGGTATANILINVHSAAGPAALAIPASGVVNITFFGIPNYTYVVQTATNPAGPWWPLSTNTAGANGVWQFTDPNATNAQQYYRSAQP